MLNVAPSADAGYYLNAQAEMDTTGNWQGKLAAELGMEGPDLNAFRWVAKGKTPHGERLTRINQADRVPFYDLTFAEPKSVSILEQVAGDDRIAAARADSIAEVMQRYVEPLARARVWDGEAQSRIITANMAWIGFDHKLSRPVGGWADPNGHTHVVVANATEHKGKRYALEIRPVKEQAPTIEAAWHTIYASKLKQLGYGVRMTQHAFEIEGVSERTIAKFSRRSEIIEAEAIRRRIRSPKGKAALAAYTREKKAHSVTPEQLKSEWTFRLDKTERQMLQGVVKMAAKGPKKPSGYSPADYAEKTLETLLRGHSAVSEEKLLIGTMKMGVGDITPEQARDAVAGLQGTIKAKVHGVTYVSTRETLIRERQVVAFALEGKMTLQRAKRGEPVTAKPGETLLVNPTFEQLWEACQSGDPLRVSYPQRHYAKPDRGSPNCWLEDKAFLWTGQEPPQPKLVQKAARVSRQVMAKVRRHVEKAKRFAFQTQEHVTDGRETQQAAQRVDRAGGPER